MTAHCWGYLADDSAAASIIDDALSAAVGHAEFADVRLIEAEELRLYTQLGARFRRAPRTQHGDRRPGAGRRALGIRGPAALDGHDAVTGRRQALATARARCRARTGRAAAPRAVERPLGGPGRHRPVRRPGRRAAALLQRRAAGASAPA